MTTVATPRSSRSVLVTVVAVVEETSDARSLIVDVPAERRRDFEYKPGQFLTLHIPSDRTGSVARCYSLSSSPFTDDRLKVTLKRTAGGYGSNWVCDNIGVGDSIEVLPPAGVFTPAGFDEDFLLFAAGSGITPVISILKSALSEGNRSVVLVYANRDEKSVIFADELRDLAGRYADRLTVVHLLESVSGRPTAQQLANHAAPLSDHRIFTCGPPPFIEAVQAAAARVGIARERVHAEMFTSLSSDPFADVVVEVEDGDSAATVEIRLDGHVHTVRWPQTATLVDLMISKGLDVPYACREGECGSCACTVVEGDVDMETSGMLDAEDIAKGYILGCQARPSSDHVRIEF